MGIFLIVIIIMKSLFFIIFTIAFLSACQIQEQAISPHDRQVTILTTHGSMGRWVILSEDTFLTARHLISECISPNASSWSFSVLAWRCHIDRKGNIYPITTITLPSDHSDGAYGTYSGGDQHIASLQLVPESSLTPWSPITIYSGSYRRMWKILARDISYIAYDTYLSGSLLSGAIITDILVDRWESGTPIWTLSGELIWVVSAVDIVGKRSYGVR